MLWMIKNRYLLLLIAVFIFTGGFFTGGLYSSHKSKQERQNPSIEARVAPKSIKNLVPKKMPKVESPKSNVLIGYVQDYRDPTTIDYSKLTHVIFSFVHPTNDGRILWSGDYAKSNLRSMVKRAHQEKTKAILAIGGWYHIQGGESYKYFKSAISNPTSRTRLINELTKVAEQENLDGIDIDFEHPKSKEDAKNLAAFTKGLSEKLHPKKKEISIAVYSKIHSVTGTEVGYVIFEPSMFNYVDYVNIMAYDGQWDGSYNAANLSPYPFTENVVRYWSQLFDQNKISKQKLVLGVPFYAQPENVKIKQISYATIVKSNPVNANKDIVAMNGTTYHYNGVPTMQKKTQLALKNGFGGMMIWELGHDASGTLSMAGVLSQELKMIKNDGKVYAFRAETK
ncbi:glycoside hydrolase family 18 protein [Peribacillus acanthi]|uniref:glycoside hydrolase family 18 protein n=1 Tax=Peribacillus acanthi TaxID=2171554 RepID=UPI001F0BA319|nr:glycoside hydrolase family 18 protein [Peribacillus acanthi]